MIRLLYISQPTHGISKEQLQDILQSSRRNNSTLNITGVLVYGGGLFMQVLEGPEENVLRLYVKILDDQRHRNSLIVFISAANERIFKNWSMGVIESDPLEFQHISELRAQRLEAVHAKTFTHAMREFVGRLQAGQVHSVEPEK
jgi:hypothetical protein